MDTKTTSQLAPESASYESELGVISEILEKNNYPVDYIPKNLKYLLILQGFTSRDTIAYLTEGDIASLEIYASRKVYALLDENDKKKFFGIYNSNPALFEIGIGNKRKLLNFADSCKRLIEKSKETIRDNNPCPQRKRKKDMKSSENEHRKIAEKITKSSSSNTGFTSGYSINHTSDTSFDSRGQAHEHSNNNANEKSITHIKKVISNYVSSFAEANLEQNLKSEIAEKLKNLEVTLCGDSTVSVKCIFCNYKYRAYSHQECNNKTRWVLSNYNQHFKRHFNACPKKRTSRKTLNIIKTIVSDSNIPDSGSSNLLNFVKIISSTESDTRSRQESTSRGTSSNSSSNYSGSLTGKYTKIPDESSNGQGITTNFSEGVTNEATSANALDQDSYEFTSDVFEGNIINNDSDCLIIESPPSEQIIDHNFEKSLEPSVAAVPEIPTSSAVQIIESITLPPLILSDDSPNFEQGRVTRKEEVSSRVSSSANTKVEKTPTPPSRQHRYQTRSMLIYDDKQSKLTDFFDVIIEKIVDETEGDEHLSNELISGIREHLENEPEFGLTETPSKILSNNLPNFLNVLKETALRNTFKKKQSNRFGESLKLFALYLFLIGGRLLYETLHRNLGNALPSITTLSRILEEKTNVNEGQIQMESLRDFLEKRDIPKKIFISEDQTAVTSRVRYDSKSNKMIGFTLPLSDNKFPKLNAFELNSVQDIKKAILENSVSRNAYVFMAQPLVDRCPSFCVCIFGSDNKFTSRDVLQRWEYLRHLAHENGIEIYGYASDGDTRCLKAMRMLTNIGSKNGSHENSPSSSAYYPYFWAEFSMDKPVAVQDTVHIATKIKTRLLNEKICLIMGKYSVSKQYLERVINEFSKDQHLLSLSCLDSTDKMNFESIDKMSSSRVIQILKDIDGAEATGQLLLVTRYILDSFLDKSITVERRVYLLWYAVFFVRGWRSWIKSNDETSLSKNFLSLNVYLCIEINAHAILVLIEKCRDDSSAFKPWLYSSQTCEKLFRQIRSMTSTYSTVVNFDMYQIMQRLARIEAINEITNDLGNNFVFPRETHNKLGMNESPADNLPMPSTEVLFSELESAKDDALFNLAQLGIQISDEALVACDIMEVEKEVDGDILSKDDDPIRQLDKQLEDDIFIIDDDPTEDASAKADLKQLQDLDNGINIDHLDLKDYYGKTKTKGSYLEVVLNNSKKMTIRKSSLLWYFFDKVGRISSDRIFRVRGTTDTGKQGKMIQNQITNESENFIEIIEENYYAVFYDQWYIGRILEKLKEDSSGDSFFKIKFLKAELDKFVWPSDTDIQTVTTNFIFHGPIQLQGTHPFTISEEERLSIEKKFKKIKSQKHV